MALCTWGGKGWGTAVEDLEPHFDQSESRWRVSGEDSTKTLPESERDGRREAAPVRIGSEEQSSGWCGGEGCKVARGLWHLSHPLRSRAIGLKDREQCTAFVFMRRGGLKALGGRLHLQQALKLSGGPIESLYRRNQARSAGTSRCPRIVLGGCHLLRVELRVSISIRSAHSPPVVHLFLRGDPLLQRYQERRNHVKLVGVGAGSRVIVVLSSLLAERRELRQLVPLDLANLLPCSGLEVCVHRDVAKNVEAELLLSHGDLDVLGLLLDGHQTGSANVQASFFVYLPNSAVQIVFVFVDLASRETPVSALLPALDEHHRVHCLVEHDGAANGDSCLVLQKLLKRLCRAVLKDPQAKCSERHGWESWIKRSDEVFVEPLRFLDLETYSGNRGQVLLREVDYEADAEYSRRRCEGMLGMVEGNAMEGSTMQLSRSVDEALANKCGRRRCGNSTNESGRGGSWNGSGMDVKREVLGVGINQRNTSSGELLRPTEEETRATNIAGAVRSNASRRHSVI
ncbi:hypothetical protein TCAP_00200 [Tolypocladium capitatum]|uniref:Uncharacterized protein n=1 Tax=Tolypocladium capitatum TaxID=45235 RepID=A0A2K3QQS1_9HYPO|nr:hypothetical protein TCAP_00200 [Tolypocladium capitatum]